jgi:DNA-binding NtrC family response regulator
MMRILIVDDEKRFADVLRMSLEAEGYADVRTAASAEEALDVLRAGAFDVLVTDLRMPGMSGIELLAEVKRRTPGTEIILMTAFAEVETAKEALKRGALDYLVKPFDNSELAALIAQVAAKLNVARGSGTAADAEVQFAGMVGASPAMKAVFEKVEKAARHDAAVLILGESGTGKELVARAIHRLGTRHRGPFVDLHCAAIPETLLESELFGHERGAFTGADARKRGRMEIAAGGMVFLDEIGELPQSLQPKLLRFLQEHQLTRIGGSETITVDVRVIAATNRNLEEEVRNGRFREDLFYRLDVIRIEVPPLRERPEDILPLVRHFLRTKGGAENAIEDSAVEVLKRYRWPGNVRELQNVIERAVLEAEGQPVDLRHLPESITGQPASGVSEPSGVLDLEANERQLIEQALKRSGGNKAAAARLLGISRRKLYSRMKKLGMDAGSR